MGQLINNALEMKWKEMLSGTFFYLPVQAQIKHKKTSVILVGVPSEIRSR